MQEKRRPKMTAEEIYKIKPTEYGWRLLPDGHWVKFGKEVALGATLTLGGEVVFGNLIEVGDNSIVGNNTIIGDETIIGYAAYINDKVRIGNNVRLGNKIVIGDWATLGNRVITGHKVWLGPDVKIGTKTKTDFNVKIGKRANIGDWVSLGHRVKINADMSVADKIEFTNTPLQIQCHPYLVYPYSWREIGVGCVIHTIDYWLAGPPRELAWHPECRPWSNYMEAIKMVASWIEEHRPSPKEGGIANQ